MISFTESGNCNLLMANTLDDFGTGFVLSVAKFWKEAAIKNLMQS